MFIRDEKQKERGKERERGVSTRNGYFISLKFVYSEAKK